MCTQISNQMMPQKKHVSSVIIALFFLVNFSFTAKAQVNVKDTTVSAFILYVSYAYQIPGGDMSEDFGHNSTIGPGLHYKTIRNWLWTAEMNFIFGSDAKHSSQIISGISTPDGHVIGTDGMYANIRPMERGFTIFAKGGKVFPVFNINPNSGLFVNIGLGYIQHKIRWDVENNNVKPLFEDYKKGYDRFTEGFALTQEFGLFLMSDSRLWNFKVNGEITESFTKTKRYNFDTMSGNPKSRIDLFFGLKVSWMIPLHGRAPRAMYFN